MVFQSYSLFPNMNAIDNVAFGLRMRKVGGTHRRKRAGELLEMVGLAPQAGQFPHQLSGGQQQRVALARALAVEPRMLLLDEPLSALDAKVRLQLREQIRTLQQRLGTTTLFVTHDQEEALSMADRIGVMRAGKLEQVAEPAELYARPTAFVAEFVGTMNRLPAELGGGGTTVTVLGTTVPVQDGGPLRPGGRPGPPGEPDRHRRRGGNGIVTHRTFLGAVTRVAILLSGDTRSPWTYRPGAPPPWHRAPPSRWASPAIPSSSPRARADARPVTGSRRPDPVTGGVPSILPNGFRVFRGRVLWPQEPARP